MISILLFHFFAGLVALGFLVLVVRRRKMPALLRGILIMGATAIVVYVAWTFVVVLNANPAPLR